MRRIDLLNKIINQIEIPVERSFVQIGQNKTSYLHAGSGKPLLLIHGGDAGAGSIRWFPVISSLASSYTVIAPDIIGYGESDKPYASYDRNYFSQWLFSFINSLNLKDIYIAGHSVGGAIALQCLVDHPKKINRLVLVNAVGLGKGIQQIPNTIKLQMIWQNLIPSSEKSRWFLEHYGIHDPKKISGSMLDVEEYGNEVIRNKGGRNVFWLGRGKVIAPFETEVLKQIQCPILIVWGENDNNYPPSIAQYTGKIINNAKVSLIPHAGHNCIYDQPEILVEIIKSFL
jgi:pimeloyl-ACP methyl ester carboxylesterase